MISGAAMQIADNKPGFWAKDYLKSVLNFKDQASWSDVIRLVAERNPEKNMWDKKWVHIVAGLTLDMLLDPLTYMGYGVIKNAFKPAEAKKLALATHKLVLEQLAKHGDEAAAKLATRVYKNTLSKALGKGFGLQAPFGSKYVKSFKGMNPVVEEILKKYKQTGVLPIEEAARKLAPGALQASRKFPAIRRVGGALGKAFNPYYQKPRELVQSLYSMEGKASGQAAEIAHELTKGFKGVDAETKKLIQTYSENVGEIIYKDPKAAAAARERAIAVTQFIEDLANNKGDVTYDSFKKLRWANRKFKGEFIDLMKGMKRWKAAKEAGKNVPNVPLKGILGEAGKYYDEGSIHYLESILAETDVGYRDLTTFAGFKGERRPFTEAFADTFKSLSDEQKDFLNARADAARGILDNWFKIEASKDIGYRYRQGYALGYRGAFKGNKEAVAIGPSMASFQKAKKFQNTQEAIQYYTKEMIKQGYAKDRDEAYKLLKKGTTQFGKINDMIDESLYMRGVEHVKAIARKEFVEDVKQWGVKVENAGGGLGFSPVEGIPELAGYVFPDEYAKFIGRHVKATESDEAAAMILKAWDKAQSWWKRYATSVNPGFSVRNAGGGFYLNYMAFGEKAFDPKIQALSAKAVWRKLMLKKGTYGKMFGEVAKDPFLDKKFIGNHTIRDLVDYASQSDIISFRFQMAEAGRAVNIKESTTYLKKFAKAVNPVGENSLVANAGERFASFIESQGRFTGFLLRLQENGGDLAEAASYVNTIQVNYRALTGFERNIMRRVIPFYSWMKQNLINQFKFIYTQPGRYARIPKLAHAFQEGAENKVPEELKPKYFQDLWLWQLPFVLPNGTPLFFNPNFPFQDLNKISLNPKEVFKNILTATSPFVKTPLEIIPKEGYDIFRGQKLEKYPGYRAPVPGILQFAARAVVKKTPNIAEKLGLRDEKGTITTNPKMAKLIENFAPFVNNYARALAATPNKENYDNIFQAISYLGGVKIKPLDIPSARYYHFREELSKRKAYWGQYD